MIAEIPYTNLTDTLLSLKIQVQDSLPYISKYIPKTIATPEELFYFLKKKVNYEKDPKGVELLQTVQTLMDNNGRGDCDCFTILTLTACHYLGFTPQEVALVGKSKYAPTHIYSLVWDNEKKKMCSMDLTNPTYCMERAYNYKQTLPFMMTLQLADNGFYPVLSGKKRKARKAARQEKRAVKKAAKVVRKTARVQARTAKKAGRANRKIMRSAAKTQRATSRQARRTDRTTQKEQRKAFKRATKVARKEKNLMRVRGRQDIIQARQDERIRNIRERQAQESFSPEYDPSADQSFLPDVPGGDYQANEGYDDFEYMPEDDGQVMFVPEGDEQYPEDFYEEELVFAPEEDYYEEGDDYGMYDTGFNDLSFFPGAGALIKKVAGGIKRGVQKIKSGKVARTAQSASSQYQQIMSLKNDNKMLKQDLERAEKNKIIYTATGSAAALLGGILIGKSM